jgi:hypothetical protein
LPTGTVVEILKGWAIFYEVEIIPSPVDINKVEGICGNFDMNANNDEHANKPHPAWRYMTYLYE